MIWFSQRKAIENAFNKWVEKNGIAKVPNSVVAFLELEGCLDEEAINEKYPVTIRTWRKDNGT